MIRRAPRGGAARALLLWTLLCGATVLTAVRLRPLAGPTTHNTPHPPECFHDAPPYTQANARLLLSSSISPLVLCSGSVRLHLRS